MPDEMSFSFSTVPDWPLFLDGIRRLLTMGMNSSSTQPQSSLRKAREQQQQVSEEVRSGPYNIS